MKHDLRQIVADYLHTLEHRQTADEVMAFYHPDIEQLEFPNALVRTTTVRGLEELRAGAEKGRQVLSRESYEIVNSYALGETVIIEAKWTGVLAIPLGSLRPGDQMKAHFAQFFEFADGKIIRQRNYDCFEPF